MKCERGAKLTLYEVLEGTRLLELGDYCISHFHSQRARVKSEGRRTGVSILLETDRSCAAEEAQ